MPSAFSSKACYVSDRSSSAPSCLCTGSSGLFPVPPIYQPPSHLRACVLVGPSVWNSSKLPMTHPSSLSSLSSKSPGPNTLSPYPLSPHHPALLLLSQYLPPPNSVATSLIQYVYYLSASLPNILKGLVSYCAMFLNHLGQCLLPSWCSVFVE